MAKKFFHPFKTDNLTSTTNAKHVVIIYLNVNALAVFKLVYLTHENV